MTSHNCIQRNAIIASCNSLKSFVLSCVILSLCASCSRPVPGISVDQYLQNRNVGSENMSAVQERKQVLEELERMSNVTSNQVFKEFDGRAAYLVGPNDVLELTLWTRTKPEKQITTVRHDGTISYSFLDDVNVSGLTTRQIDDLLTEKLKYYMRSVRLDVVVSDYQSKSALLFGEINILQTGKSGPGKYTLSGKTTILDLVVNAGGDTKDSDLKNVELVRGGKKYTINLFKIMFQGDINQNVVIDDGDIVTVPELPALGERVYVFGEVNQVGIYPHEDAYDLLAALGIAQGYTNLAIEEDIKIIRGFGPGKKPIVISANVDSLLKDGDVTQNVKLQNGDVVYVPRTVIGDINEFITNTTPLLNYLLYPATYRDDYSDPTRLRYFMR